MEGGDDDEEDEGPGGGLLGNDYDSDDDDEDEKGPDDDTGKDSGGTSRRPSPQVKQDNAPSERASLSPSHAAIHEEAEAKPVLSQPSLKNNEGYESLTKNEEPLRRPSIPEGGSSSVFSKGQRCALSIRGRSTALTILACTVRH